MNFSYILFHMFTILGPIGLPLVGYLPFLDVTNIGRSFQRISKRYGDIFSIMVGTKPLVILNSWPLIKEAMAKKELAGRPNIFSGTFFQKGKTGWWKIIRIFVLVILKPLISIYQNQINSYAQVSVQLKERHGSNTENSFISKWETFWMKVVRVPKVL